MNPPLTPDERSMFTEIMTQLRHNHDELHTALNRVSDDVNRVDGKLSDHVMLEDGQYDELNERITALREDVATLKTRWGILASLAAALGAVCMTIVNKFFFQ